MEILKFPPPPDDGDDDDGGGGGRIFGWVQPPIPITPRDHISRSDTRPHSDLYIYIYIIALTPISSAGNIISE